jgi:hypothetical protein
MRDGPGTAPAWLLSLCLAAGILVASAALPAGERSQASARPADATPASAGPGAGPPASPMVAGPRLPAHASHVVDYTIAATLDAVTKEVRGRQRLVWRNPSTDAVPDLWFHLYLNAFKNSKSTFYRESGGRLRGDDMPKDGWGYIDVTALRLADGTDLTGAAAFEAPDDGNAGDQTVMRVPLPQPVPPGGSVALDVEFIAKLPRVFARTGFKDDFYLVGQWFPKIAVYEPAGMRGRATGGWNCHQFHANSEFYADFGHFDVTLTVPSSFVVGATGERTASTDNGDGTTTYRYVQGDVHDFAGTADPNFIEQRHRFSATEDVTAEEYRQVAQLLDRTDEEVRLSDVEIILLLQRPHLPQADRYLRAAKLGIKWFGLWYGRYPYRTLTVVDPAPGAGGAGGMEYPTFITGGTSFIFNRWPFGEVRGVEAVTVHEFGHQFWYGLIANNEFEEAWLDEGFNSYSSARVMEAGHGREATLVRFLGLTLGAGDAARLSNNALARFDRVRQPAWTYQGGTYGFYSYQKPELLLRTLEHYLGEPTMARVMRTYHERWRFRHPSSDDFYAVANEVSGQDLTWFFRQAVEGTEVLDYEVSSVMTKRTREPAGYLDENGARRLVAQEGDDGRARGAAGGTERYTSTVMVRRRGDLVFPVEIDVKFEGQPAERVAWDGMDRWTRLEYERDRKLEWASVDPDRRVPLDVDWMNNARRVEPDSRVALAWSARWLFWMQQVIATVGW